MTHSAGVAALDPPVSRWPGVVGVIGIVLAALTLLDKAGDLLTLIVWSEADWNRILAPELARIVVRALPPPAWLVLSSLVWIALAALLLSGSLRLRRRQRSGVSLCRLWSRLAIGWFAFEMAVGLWWLSTIADEISALAPGWQGPAILGILLAVVLMLAYPVFLLVWLAQPRVIEEFRDWPE